MIKTSTRSLAVALAGVALITTASAANFSVSGAGGSIPDPALTPGTWNVVNGYTGVAFTSGVSVANAVTSITSVKLSGFQHTWRGDLHIILKDPLGNAHNVVVRPGSTGGAAVGSSGDYLLGDHTFVTSGGTPINTTTINQGTGTYNQFFNTGTGQWTAGIANTPLTSITGPAGTWTLEIRDWANLDLGSLTGWTLSGTDNAGGGPFTSFCGNGSAGQPACPCGQAGTAGSGCNNSDSTGGALLTAAGTTSPDTVVFTMTGGPVAAQPVIFFQGDSTGIFTPFGDGIRCVGGNLFRLYTKTTAGGSASAPAGGDGSVTATSAAFGDPIAPGSVRHYQAYYRDGAPFCTADTFNSSNAISVQW